MISRVNANLFAETVSERVQKFVMMEIFRTSMVALHLVLSSKVLPAKNWISRPLAPRSVVMVKTSVSLNAMMVTISLEMVAMTSARKKFFGSAMVDPPLALIPVLCLSKLKNFLNAKILQHSFQTHAKIVYHNHWARCKVNLLYVIKTRIAQL